MSAIPDRRLLAALIASLLCPFAHAADSGVYLFGSAGATEYSSFKSSFDDHVAAAGFTGIQSSVDKYDRGLKGGIGYNFNRYFGLEAGYVSLGKSDYSATVTGGSATGRVKAGGAVLSGVATAPLGGGFSVFGKAGIINAKVQMAIDVASAGGPAEITNTATRTKGAYGVGIAYDLDARWSVRSEYEYFREIGAADTTGTANVFMFSLGVVYKMY
jgi:OmpA-OmpF porin, OOP family